MAPVTMYTLSTCPWCFKAKKFFSEKKVEFDFTDYDTVGPEEQKRIVAEMKELGGSTAFPFVRIGDHVVVGYDPERYAELLGRER
ncbi:MAG: glutaredoxin family protein [Terriglobia bacterium]